MLVALAVLDTAGLVVVAAAFTRLLGQRSAERTARAKAETMACSLCRSQVLIGDYLRHQRWHSQTSMATLYGAHVVTPTEHLQDKYGR